jgi:hypothetical protein
MFIVLEPHGPQVYIDLDLVAKGSILFLLLIMLQ